MNVLIIKFGAVGDALLATPAIRALKKHWPDSRFVVMAKEPADQIFRGNPHIDDVVVFRERTIIPKMTNLLRYWLHHEVRRELRGHQFDWCVDFDSHYKSYYWALYSGARRRAGFALTRRRYLNPLYHMKVPQPSAPMSQVKRYVGLAEVLGASADGWQTEFEVASVATRRMDEWLDRQGVEIAADGRAKLAVIAPATLAITKRWPIRHYRELARRVTASLGWQVLVVWGPGEEPYVRELADPPHVVVAPPTNLHELGALLRRARVVVSNDTAPFHLGVAVGTPTVGLFGATNPLEWMPPLGADHVSTLVEPVPCHPCNKFFHCRIGTHACMEDLDVERVLNRVKEMGRVST